MKGWFIVKCPRCGIELHVKGGAGFEEDGEEIEHEYYLCLNNKCGVREVNIEIIFGLKEVIG